jgi:hypothetical protein
LLWLKIFFTQLHGNIQLDSWYIANITSWSFILIGIAGAAYWIKKLKEFDDNGEEDKDSTSHSFL